MKYGELIKLFNFSMPEYAAEYYEDFEKSYDRGRKVICEEDIDLIAQKTKLPEDGTRALKDCAAAVNADEKGHMCASFLVHLTVLSRAPWLNYIYTDDLFDVPGLKKEQVGWVIVACQLLNTLKNKKPPEDKNEENLNAFRGYSQNCFNKNGYWGILEWHWNMLCAGGCMFMFGILKFVPGAFGGDFPVLTDGEKYLSLVGGEYYFNAEGALVDSEEKSCGKTSFYEDGEKIIANAVSARGKVDPEPREYKMSEWRDFLRKGTPTLDIHIPSGVEYTPERIKEACGLALDFFKDFYPDFAPRAIAGYSWIFAPQLEKVLAPGSNILRVNRAMHILPTTGYYGADCRFLRQGSPLQQRIAAEFEKGTEFHYSVMYIPVGELETFGKEAE
ncbi:MAG: hypothetical protein J5925_03250 [Clostridia bacterium]|nr:hypothetical protein [Clostridia bacterium]